VRLGRTIFDDLVETSLFDALLAFSTGILLLFALADIFFFGFSAF
jgi:hypothetical protein